MVDKIDRIDSNLYQVQDAAQEHDQRRRQDQEAQENEEDRQKQEKDRFKREGEGWKKIVAVTGRGKSLQSPLMPDGTLHSDEGSRQKMTQEENSLRVLVLWGIRDLRGRPRWSVIIGYFLVLSVLILSVATIVGILWP